MFKSTYNIVLNIFKVLTLIQQTEFSKNVVTVRKRATVIF